MNDDNEDDSNSDSGNSDDDDDATALILQQMNGLFVMKIKNDLNVERTHNVDRNRQKISMKKKNENTKLKHFCNTIHEKGIQRGKKKTTTLYYRYKRASLLR